MNFHGPWVDRHISGELETVLQHFPVGFSSSDAHSAVAAGKPLDLLHILDPSVFSQDGENSPSFHQLG